MIKGQNTFSWEKEDIFNTPVKVIILVVKDTVIKNLYGYIGITKDDLVKEVEEMKAREMGGE